MKNPIEHFLGDKSTLQAFWLHQAFVGIMQSKKVVMKKYTMTRPAFILVLLTLAAGLAHAQGYVSGVTVTTSKDPVQIPIGSKASYGAGVTTGTPQPEKEWQVVPGSVKYAWSVSLGAASPADAPETTINTITFNNAQDYSSTVNCVVSYQVQKSDPGQSDDGQIATISGHDPYPKSVIIHVGDFSLSVAPSSLTIDSGALGGATLDLSFINGGVGSGIAFSSTITGIHPGNIGISFGNDSGPNESPNRIPITLSSADGTNDGLTDETFTITITGTAGSLSHSTTITLTVTPKPGLFIQFGSTSTKSLKRDANNQPVLDILHDQVWVPVADLPGQGTYGLPAGSAPDAGPDTNVVSLVYKAVRSGNWVAQNSHYDWKSGLKDTEAAAVIDAVGGVIPDFDVWYSKAYRLGDDGPSGMTIEGDGLSSDDISLSYFEDPNNPPTRTAKASFLMDLHDEYQNYTDHSYDVTDWNNPGPFIDKVSGTSGKAGDQLIVSGIILHPVDVDFEIGTTDIPIPWLRLLGVRVNVAINHEYITVPEGVSTTADAPGEYTYAVVGKHYNEHIGNTYHYTSAGYVGEVPFDYKEVNENSPVTVTYHQPLSHTTTPTGGP